MGHGEARKALALTPIAKALLNKSRVLDLNGDGLISVEELLELAAEEGVTLSREQAEDSGSLSRSAAASDCKKIIFGGNSLSPVCWFAGYRHCIWMDSRVPRAAPPTSRGRGNSERRTLL